MRTRFKVTALLLCAAFWASGCSDHTDTTTSAFITLANLNVLHGFDCDPPVPGDGDQCRVAQRIALLREHIVAAGCPDVIALQEVLNQEFVTRSPTEMAGPLESIVELINAELPNLAAACGFTYGVTYQPFLNVLVSETDEELILSRYPILQTNTRNFHSALYDEPAGLLLFLRHALHVRIDHPTGEVDVYTTHLASGSDSASNNCNSFRELVPGTGVGPRVACPQECDSDDTVRACQAEQLAMFVEQTRGVNSLALISGDFNAVPGTSEYNSMIRRGWLDSHLAAGAAECDSASGIGCTSGRGSSAESLENPVLGVNRRIDYIFAALPPDNTTCKITDDRAATAPTLGAYAIDSAGIFAGEPNPFVSACGSPPDDICWVSDHVGNIASIVCQR